MQLDAGITNVSSAGTRVRVNNDSSGVRWVRFKALAGNSGLTYVGVYDVSASAGYELSAGNTIDLNFGEFGGSVEVNEFWVDAATNNDKVSWIMILK
jgi:hypothetical protein